MHVKKKIKISINLSALGKLVSIFTIFLKILVKKRARWPNNWSTETLKNSPNFFYWVKIYLIFSFNAHIFFLNMNKLIVEAGCIHLENLIGYSEILDVYYVKKN
jgi:hypothetical protein